uniref:Vacuolar fusion protein MON1 homolog n=1 Tax=Globisporangium ultimum (strain ATCC 200006 / CBS 805.95 / DAOM BR144) TaxID=431595 RepID=K3WJ71_GLOUD
MDVEVVVCSSSGKPIFHYERPSRGSAHDASTSTTCTSSSSCVSTAKSSFVSSLQGLLSFVSCMQHEELQELETDGCRCFFQTRENLTFAVILRSPSAHPSTGSDSADAVPDVTTDSLQRLIHLLHSQILFVLTERGLDVLRRQPGYDLRELLSGTERVMAALCDRWATDPTLRFHDLGVAFVRLAPGHRMVVTRALEYEPSGASLTSSSSASAGGGGGGTGAMICGIVLAKKQIVAVSHPNKKQFNILVDDLLLLLNFVYHTPSLAKSETWTPICLPSFNSSGFLYAYVVFLTADICLLLLSSQQSPEQFHSFHAKKEFIADQLAQAGTIDAIHDAVQSQSEPGSARWQPHGDLPLLSHFIYKNELTGECATSELEFPFDNEDVATNTLLLNQYAKLHHVMYPFVKAHKSQAIGKRRSSNLKQGAIASRMTFARSEHGLFIGMCTDEHRLYACFDSLTSVTEARQQCQVLAERLRYDDELVSPPFFVTGFGGGSSRSLWP